VAKRRLDQLLEELLTDPGEEDGDLVFVVLLLEASVAKDHKLGGLRQGRQVAVEVPRLLL
jgi:hypothetical protein